MLDDFSEAAGPSILAMPAGLTAPTQWVTRPLDCEFPEAAIYPDGITRESLQKAMNTCCQWLSEMNELNARMGIPKVERDLSPATLSTMVSDFFIARLADYSGGKLVVNKKHNGHPDLVPAGVYPDDAVHQGGVGIEIKTSRCEAWGGHNREGSYLLVVGTSCETRNDPRSTVRPFCFRFVGGETLTKEDWRFSGRGEDSRRTPTTALTPSGRSKLTQNALYKAA
jgi:hypothetical protein